MSSTAPADPHRTPGRSGAGDAIGESSSRAERWLAENQAALESSNAFVAEHGLPLTPIWARRDGRRRELGDTATR